MDQNVLVENLSQVNVEICVGVQKLFCCPSKRLDTFFVCSCFVVIVVFFPETVIAGTGFLSFLLEKVKPESCKTKTDFIRDSKNWGLHFEQI